MSDRPWWAPDTQGFLAGASVIGAHAIIILRMVRPATPDDKILDVMTGVLFTTCLVAVYNFSFGSSRGSQAKDESQANMVNKLTKAVTGTDPSTPPPTPGATP